MTTVSLSAAKAQAGVVKLDLQINDKSLPKRVIVGKDSEHPAEMPFRLLAVPEKLCRYIGNGNNARPQR